MNCLKCNTPLVNGVCPNCGYIDENVVNMKTASIVKNSEEVIILNDSNSSETGAVKASKIVSKLTDSNKEKQEENTFDTLVDVNTSPKKKKTIKLNFKFNKDAKMPTFMAVVLCVLFLVIGIAFGNMFFSKTIVTSNVSSVSKESLTSNGKKNETNISGVTYKIPTKYPYDKTLRGVLVYDPLDNFRIFMRMEDGSYEILKSSLTSIKETIKNTNLVVGNAKEVDIDGNKAIAVEVTDNFTNILLAYVSAGKDKVHYIEIVTSDNKYNYDVLKLAMEILKDSKEENKKSKMEKIDVYDVSELAKMAANKYSELTYK